MSFSKTFPRKRELPEALRELAGDDHAGAILRAAADRIEELEKMDRQAGEHVEEDGVATGGIIIRAIPT